MVDAIAKKVLEVLMGILKPELIFKVIVSVLRSLAKSTANTLDDKIVDEVAKALGVA